MTDTPSSNEDLIEELADVLSDTCDLDVGWHQYAKAVVERLDKLGLSPRALADDKRASDAALENLREAGAAWPGKSGVLLTFAEVTAANVARCNRWHHGGLTDWSIADWAVAMAGEAGEVCNAIKKLRRIEDEIANISDLDRQLSTKKQAIAKIGEEIADTFLYLNLLAHRLGLTLADEVVAKFNATSERYGFPERLTPTEVAQREREAELRGFEAAVKIAERWSDGTHRLHPNLSWQDTAESARFAAHIAAQEIAAEIRAELARRRAEAGT